MKRVGIFQNTFTAGGRIKVVSAMTGVFNDLGVIPDWIGFRSTLPEEQLTKGASGPVRARLRLLRNATRGLSEYKYLRLNQRIEAMSKEYELLVNSNNTLASLRGSPNFMHYVHFPREAQLLSEYSNSMIHSQFARDFFLRMYRFFQHDVGSSAAFIANSDFTKSAMLDVYPLDPGDIRVIYPPADGFVSGSQTQKVRSGVISLGRFGENKNQLLQIRVAEKVRGTKFSIVGFVNNARSLRYFRMCNREIRKKGLSNVRLIRDAPGDQVAEELSSAKVFMHTMVDEHFGISTVEAMSFGCIPLCHNSGGQREIVNNSELLFTDLSDAVVKLERLIRMGPEESDRLRADMLKRSSRFSSGRFVTEFTQVLKDIGFA